MKDGKWLGLAVGDFVIKELYAEGSFSWIYRAVHMDGRTSKAVKIGKPTEELEQSSSPELVPTQAMGKIAGVFERVQFDAQELLQLQFLKLESASDRNLIEVELFNDLPEGSYYRMPICSGSTLRQYMKAGPVPLRVIYDLASALDRLSKLPKFGYHGDLKPENILITPAGVKLIDPGFFGVLKSAAVSGARSGSQSSAREEIVEECAITTPSYYPSMEPDDLFALGLIIWEIACKKPLLTKVSNLGDQEKSFLAEILQAQSPGLIRPGMPQSMESFVLKAARLKRGDDKTLQLESGFASFAEMAEALSALMQTKITYL